MSGSGKIDVREKAMVVLFWVRSVSFAFDCSRRRWILRRIVGLGQEAFFRDAGWRGTGGCEKSALAIRRFDR
jgi:hypothetical protein